MLLFVVFTVLPVLISIFLSFTYFNVLEAPEFVGLNNYFRLIMQDSLFMIALKNTLVLAVVTGPVSFFLCLLLAWLVNEFPPKLRAVFTLLFYAPTLSGGAYMVWSIILNGDSNGLLNSLLMSLYVAANSVADRHQLYDGHRHCGYPVDESGHQFPVLYRRLSECGPEPV